MIRIMIEPRRSNTERLFPFSFSKQTSQGDHVFREWAKYFCKATLMQTRQSRRFYSGVFTFHERPMILKHPSPPRPSPVSLPSYNKHYLSTHALIVCVNRPRPSKSKPSSRAHSGTSLPLRPFCLATIANTKTAAIWPMSEWNRIGPGSVSTSCKISSKSCRLSSSAH